MFACSVQHALSIYLVEKNTTRFRTEYNVILICFALYVHAAIQLSSYREALHLLPFLIKRKDHFYLYHVCYYRYSGNL